MGHIQVDMFEVQLGAALLLQFRTGQGPVRVLADAGVKAAGYAVDHVHRKLPEAFDAFGDPTRRIDLMLGTHYDEDHLVGLVPIAADESIAIGEAWLPPVADDTDERGPSRALTSDDLLVTRLAGPDRAARLSRYLQAKHRVCVQAARVERAADAMRLDRPRAARPELDLADPRSAGSPTDWATVFRTHAADAAITLGGSVVDETHADVVYEGAADSAAALRPREGGADMPEDPDQWPARWAGQPPRAAADARDLAVIRRAAARDAINAIALAEVVAALAARAIPIRCPIIPDGRQARFRWSQRDGRFVPATRRSPAGLGLTLLGPSEGLVAKHWHRLPVGAYVARSRAAGIPILSITPSNQLSSVVRFESEGQGILVCGDAGFVDFAPAGGQYHPELLAALLPAHVVQVAHHAGNNAHFYRALLAAGYAEQPDRSLLLVSHATRDRHRPSAAFAAFVARLRPGPDGPRVLFTSKPAAARGRSIRDAAHPVVGQPHLVGDVRLSYDGGAWVVQRHSVRA